tara:strand:- start:276 stop:866 length:591 start_codon:yes stop_codon:yes gene_type:complete
MTAGLPDAKIALRLIAQGRRAEAHRARAAAAGSGLAERFVAALASRLIPRSVVSLYLPMRDEIDTLPLAAALDRLGVVTALPVMQGSAAPLAFRIWRSGDELVRRAFGVDEPAAGARARPDILAVPLLAFDAAGNRLGYGGGYYDRTLAALRRDGRVLAVGVAYDEQEVPAVPVDDWDERLDMVVTDCRVLTFSAA